MKPVLSVSLGAARDDYTVQAQILNQTVQLARVGTDGDWARALDLLRASDGRVAAMGLEGPWRPRDSRLRAAREAVRAARLADGQRLRPILARRAVAALEARLNKGGKTLEGRQALLPRAARVACLACLAENLAAFGCSIVAGDLLAGLGLPLPLRGLRLLRIFSPLLQRLPESSTAREDRSGRAASHWQALLEQADVLGARSPADLEGIGRTAGGKIVVLETAGPEAAAALLRDGAEAVVVAGPEVGGRCLQPDAVEALLLALIEKAEMEIGVADLEAAVARIPLRPAVRGPDEASG